MKRDHGHLVKLVLNFPLVLRRVSTGKRWSGASCWVEVAAAREGVRWTVQN